MKYWIAAVLMIAGFASPLEAAIMLHQVEDFSGVHDWSGGDPNPNPPVILADSGPLGGGDPALRVTSNGGSGPGGKLLIFNNSSWTGNHSAAGVTRITLALRNTGSTTLSFRLAFNGLGGWFATPAAPLAPFTGWVTREFDTRPSALVNVAGSDAAATMATVSQMRILHSSAPDFRGAQVAGSFMVDSIQAVPEPSTATLLGLAGAGCFFRKRFVE